MTNYQTNWLLPVATMIGVFLTCAPVAAQQAFRRGDANGNGIIEITDALLIQNLLFFNPALVASLCCPDAADINDDGQLDTSDAVLVVSYLFGGAGNPVPPCEFDQTADQMGCMIGCSEFDANGAHVVTADGDVAAWTDAPLVVDSGSILHCTANVDWLTPACPDVFVLWRVNGLLMAWGPMASTASQSFEVAPGDQVTVSFEFHTLVNNFAEVADTIHATLVIGNVSDDFERGDCNADGAVNIADAVRSLQELFAPSQQPLAVPCTNACDSNDDEVHSLVDVVHTLSALFYVSVAVPVEPIGSCGPDPIGYGLGCDDYSACTP